jgi:LacI family transcriptional regulator
VNSNSSDQGQRLRKAPTIIDVAESAGVSKSTVSNVLQGKPNVNGEIRARVVEAMERLGYHVHAGARFMRQRSNVIGVVAGDLSNPFDAELAAIVEAECAANGFSMLLATTGGSPNLDAERVRVLLEHRVAAALFLIDPSKAALSLVKGRLPLAFLCGSGERAGSITVDSCLGVQQAVEHLVGLGHQEIGFVSLMLADEPALEAQRYRGYMTGMKSAGLQPKATQVLREQGHRQALQQTYRQQLVTYLLRDDRPTAIVAALDNLALEIMEVADGLHIRIPEELSIVGFDDIRISRHSRVALTTVSQQAATIAAEGVRVLIDSLSSPQPNVPSSVTVPPKLLVRSTTAKPSS